MTASAEYLQEYQKTEAAYTDGKLDEAASLVYQLVEDYPQDPFARLLCGHIYYGLQQYDVAREQYEVVLNLTDDPELVEQAQTFITEADQFCENSDPNSSLEDISFDDDLEDEAPETLLEDFNTDEEINGDLDFDQELDLGAIDELTNLNTNKATSSDNTPSPPETLSEQDLDLDFDDDQDISLEDIDLSEPFDFDQQESEDELDDMNLGSLDISESELDAKSGGTFEGQNSQNSPLELDEDDFSEPFDLEDNFDPLELEANPLADDSNLNLDDEVDSDLTNPLNNPFSQAQKEDTVNSQLPESDPDFAFDLDNEDPFTLDEQPEDNQLNETVNDIDDPLSGSLEQLSDDLFEEDLVDSDLSQSPAPEPVVAEENLDLGEEDFDDEAFSLTDLPLIDESEEIQDQNSAPRNTSSSVQEELDIGEIELDVDDEDESDDIFAPLEEVSDHIGDQVKETPGGNHSSNGKAFVDHDLDLPIFEDISDDLDADDQAETLLTDSSDASYNQEPIPDNESDFDFNEFSEDDDSGYYQGDNSGFEVDDIPDSFDLDNIEEETVPDSQRNGATSGMSTTTASRSEVSDEFLEDFEEFDDLQGFDISTGEASAFLPDSADFEEDNIDSNFLGKPTNGLDNDSSAIYEDDVFNTPTERETITTFTNPTEDTVDTNISVDQGSFSILENQPLKVKSLCTALATGVVTLIAVAVTTYVATNIAARNDRGEVVNYLRTTGWFMTLVAGAASFSTAWIIGKTTAKQLEKATTDLQSQFDAISRGNLNARVSVYAEDELGQMCAKFNYMAQFIESTTREAQRKAEEQEEAKENLQRQVIRLLDDVEGAARGDLTVSAEVTADVLGAVADSFNLTIQNLREIVVQVKQAARQVSKGATDSASFAKDVAGDALRQAEELAATLNSVQQLTDAIQRVADSAKEAEEVARAAAAVATKGGEAVQMTVAGILKIRETVAETTRDVKRLAESSQEISKIVAIISNIASRTNLLALNASIEAARAGEAGRGFAIVADEVRQLADKSAKSLKEIEQIVMQIQSQTSSVMMAMEEGNQQVIEGTRLAEQAKRSLDDIIQVTNRIDVLVRSITADTVEQNETARAVAQVMQAVEISAQETSQEAQRVASALSNLVGVARDLLTSVERFRVDPSERS